MGRRCTSTVQASSRFTAAVMELGRLSGNLTRFILSQFWKSICSKGAIRSPKDSVLSYDSIKLVSSARVVTTGFPRAQRVEGIVRSYGRWSWLSAETMLWHRGEHPDPNVVRCLRRYDGGNP